MDNEKWLNQQMKDSREFEKIQNTEKFIPNIKINDELKESLNREIKMTIENLTKMDNESFWKKILNKLFKKI